MGFFTESITALCKAVARREHNQILIVFLRICCLVTQLCPTFCNPMDCNPPGSSVSGILQARILECGFLKIQVLEKSLYTSQIQSLGTFLRKFAPPLQKPLKHLFFANGHALASVVSDCLRCHGL